MVLSGSLRPVVFIGDIKGAEPSAARELTPPSASTDPVQPPLIVTKCALVVYENK